MNKYNDNENVVESLHRARMEQWIGDFEEAEKIYDAILNYKDNIVIYLKPSIENNKQRLLEDKKGYQRETDFLEDSYYEQMVLVDVSSENNTFGSNKKIEPLIKEKKIVINHPVESIWKYSLIANSKANHEIRFEIRGYAQTKQRPDLRNLTEDAIDDEISNLVFIPLQQQSPDMVCMDIGIHLENQILPCYIEIDSWGSISGEAIVPDNRVKAFFARQNELFSRLESILWLDLNLPTTV